MFRKLVFLCSALAVLAGARADPVRVGYQTSVVPTAVAIVDGEFARAAGVPIEWRRFDSGAEVVRALASGDLDIGSVGSSLVAAAAARQLPVETFLIASQLGISEALVVRRGSGIAVPTDLVGKTVAVPFVSTCHYSLLAALKHWGIDRSRVKIVNLRPSEIPAAWARGDIDAAYVWDPALGRIKETGIVLATSVDAARWGAPTYDVWIVRKDFSARHAPFLGAFARTSLELMQRYAADPKSFAGSAANLGDIVKATGAKPEDVPGLLAGNTYPPADEQRRLLDAGFVAAVADTAAFLKEQGKIDVVLPDYHAYSTSRFLPAASASAPPSAPAPAPAPAPAHAHAPAHASMRE